MSAVLRAGCDPREAMAAAEPIARRAPLRVLTLTTLYPSSVEPRHGIFVETRLRKLRELHPVDLQVIAPVPWFPITWRAAGRYATFAATPRSETREGVAVRHPRFVVIPRVGMALQPAALARAFERSLRGLAETGWACDVIDTHYLYPDGVAAAAVAAVFGCPFVVTARGSDVNLISQMPAPRRRILAALEQASRVITVSMSLKRELVKLGVPGGKIEVLRNGVDLKLFCPSERDAARARLGVAQEPLVASVGNLVPEKGHDLVVAAVARLPRARLVIVGRGPERERLMSLAVRLGVAGRVQFLDNVAQPELATIYSAADVLALGSTREGWPNVLLEAMACGTPVVAADVGGVSEIVGEHAGEVVSTRDPEQFALALQRVAAGGYERVDVRAYAERFAWEPVAARYFEILREARASRPMRTARH